MPSVTFADFGFGGAAAIVFIYVVLRLIAELRLASRRLRLRAAGAMVFTVAVPLALLPPDWFGGSDPSAAYLYGSALWVVLALAFAAFAISRAEAPRRPAT